MTAGSPPPDTVTDTRSDAPTRLPTIRLVGTSAARPFSQPSRERLGRMFARVGITDIREEGDDRPDEGRVVLVRADHVFDDALARPLVEREDAVLLAPGSRRPVAANVTADKVEEARRLLTSESSPTWP